MVKIVVTQKVKLFSDEKSYGTQEIIIDPNDENEPWCCINHDNNEISLSLKNMDALFTLYQDAKKLMNLEDDLQP